MKLHLLILATLCLLAGCTDADWKENTNLNVEHHISIYSGGKEVGSWTSTGTIGHHEGGMFYFEDKATHRLVEVYGELVITQP